MFQPFQKTVLKALLTVLFLSASSSFAEEETKPVPSSLSAETILLEANQRMYAVKDQTAQVTFRVVNANGVEKKTVFRLYWKNYIGQENLVGKILLVTEFPAHDKGEKFLLWERTEENQSDLWLYLPDLRQVRRIQQEKHRHDKEDDSDLLFEDIHPRPIDRDEHRLLPDETVRGESCAVIETLFKGHPLYLKKRVYISKGEGVIRRIDFFSPAGGLLKTQSIDWQKIDQVWVWKTSQVVHANALRKTFVEMTDVKVNVGLTDDQFSERALRR